MSSAVARPCVKSRNTAGAADNLSLPIPWASLVTALFDAAMLATHGNNTPKNYNELLTYYILRRYAAEHQVKLIRPEGSGYSHFHPHKAVGFIYELLRGFTMQEEGVEREDFFEAFVDGVLSDPTFLPRKAEEWSRGITEEIQAKRNDKGNHKTSPTAFMKHLGLPPAILDLPLKAQITEVIRLANC
jgi:hypothetical protein